MVNRIKEFFDIAFESKTRACVIFTDFSDKTLQSPNSLVRSFVQPARIRIKDESPIENRVKNSVDSMVQNPVRNFCFMNISRLRIIDVKWTIRAVAISFIFELQVDIKQIIFQISLKQLNIVLIAFALAESLPSQKQIFLTYNLIKEVVHV